MTGSSTQARASKIWFDSENLWLLLSDGRQVAVPLVYFPRLFNAAPEQRDQFETSGGGTAIHWEDLDEDIRVEGLLLGYGDTSSRV